MKIKQILKISVVGLMLIAIGLITPTSVLADEDKKDVAPEGVSSLTLDGITPDEIKNNKIDNPTIKNGINLLLYIVGTLAVVMIIVGGLKYVTSGGDSGKVGEAKNTILYSIIGLIVAILAFAIVNYVIDRFITNKDTTSLNQNQSIII